MKMVSYILLSMLVWVAIADRILYYSTQVLPYACPCVELEGLTNGTAFYFWSNNKSKFFNLQNIVTGRQFLN